MAFSVASSRAVVNSSICPCISPLTVSSSVRDASIDSSRSLRMDSISAFATANSSAISLRVCVLLIFYISMLEPLPSGICSDVVNRVGKRSNVVNKSDFKGVLAHECLPFHRVSLDGGPVPLHVSPKPISNLIDSLL